MWGKKIERLSSCKPLLPKSCIPLSREFWKKKGTNLVMILRAIFLEHLCSAICYLSRSFADCLRLMDKIWQSGWDGYNSAKWLMGFAYQLFCKIFFINSKVSGYFSPRCRVGRYGSGGWILRVWITCRFASRPSNHQLLDGRLTSMVSCLSWLKVGDFFHLSFSSNLKGQNHE